MWGRARRISDSDAASDAPVGMLRAAVRRTRVENAEKSSVVVDLRDAELARLDLLNDALDPLFKETPPEIDLFDRGISRGDTPRLWVDAVAHVAMGRDKRRYRFVLDSRYGRKVLAESNDIPEMVEAVTHYVASRIIDRERALLEDDTLIGERMLREAVRVRRRRRWRWARAFLFGLLVGGIAVFATLWMIASQIAD